MTFAPPTQSRALSMPDKFTPTNPFLHPARADSIRTMGANGLFKLRPQQKWASILATPNSWTVQGNFNPWDIPENYGDDGDTGQERLGKLHDDTRMACRYAYRYRALGDNDDAARAVAIIQAYSTVTSFETNPGSTLSWFDAWPPLIQAALMVRESSHYTTAVHNAFRSTILTALSTLEPIAYTRRNNWAAWGLTMEFAAAIFLNQRGRFDNALFRWRELFRRTVVNNFRVDNGGPAQGQLKNNVTPFEIYRMGAGQGNGAYGLLYSAFHLDGMTIAAEWARLGGEWLFDHVNPDGSSFEGLWRRIAYEKRFGAPNLSTDFLNVQWYNTSNMNAPGTDYYWSGYYTNRVGGGFYIAQAMWPDQNGFETMYGGFMTLDIAPGQYPTYPSGNVATMSNGYAIAQDYYGMYGCDVAYSDRPLYG